MVLKLGFQNLAVVFHAINSYSILFSSATTPPPTTTTRPPPTRATTSKKQKTSKHNHGNKYTDKRQLHHSSSTGALTDSRVHYFTILNSTNNNINSIKR
jgi:hypothetical protein